MTAAAPPRGTGTDWQPLSTLSGGFKLRALLSSPVVQIDTSGDDVIVTDEHGALHAARQVIVTVSIGVLQSEMIDFVPDLPESTVSAYSGIGMDMGMKVPMRFSSAWWETEGEAMAWLVTEGLAGACWAPSDYKEDSISHILMCYPMGDNGAELTDIGMAAGGGEAGDEAIIEAILADLDMTFPQALDQASEHYLEGLVQNWGAEPYTLGVYSYPKVGTYVTASNSKRKDLQEPVADDRVFFAGEGSHTTHPATVPGALHEGERAAGSVHEVNGEPHNPPALPSEG
jgi:monoamine oxidase